MASTPPTELPPQPSEPASPDVAPPEFDPVTPDIDIPAPAPIGDPGTAPASPTDLGDFA